MDTPLYPARAKSRNSSKSENAAADTRKVHPARDSASFHRCAGGEVATSAADAAAKPRKPAQMLALRGGHRRGFPGSISDA